MINCSSLPRTSPLGLEISGEHREFSRHCEAYLPSGDLTYLQTVRNAAQRPLAECVEEGAVCACLLVFNPISHVPVLRSFSDEQGNKLVQTSSWGCSPVPSYSAWQGVYIILPTGKVALYLLFSLLQDSFCFLREIYEKKKK